MLDDGSTDNTAAEVERALRRRSARAADALQQRRQGPRPQQGPGRGPGRDHRRLDADTLFPPDTIARLVRWFADPRVGAVAGNALVGNRLNMVTRWQALEYVTAQNLERRALAALGAVTVVPGAVGRLAARRPWRRWAAIRPTPWPRTRT